MAYLYDYFENLTSEEWEKYLSTDLFEKMYIAKGTLYQSDDILENMTRPRLLGLISTHNNRVLRLRITYAICKHYYDKGIPDEPWYINNGEGISYFPKFTQEHFMRKYWFDYFADIFYLIISSIWDSFLKIIDEYYWYDIADGPHFLHDLLKKLEDDKPILRALFDNIYKDKLYRDAKDYRNGAAHGSSVGDIKNNIKKERNIVKEVYRFKDGKMIPHTETVQYYIAISAGEYTNARTIMKNMEDYSRFSGEKMQEAIKLMISDKAII